MSVVNVGIDLGGTNLKLAVIDESNAIIMRHTVPTEGHLGHDHVISNMVRGVHELRQQIGDGVEVESIGVGVPGMVEMTTGVVLDLPNLPGKWPNVSLRSI